MVKSPESKVEFDQLVENAAGKLIVIDFYATWCGPCKLMAPKFEKLADEFKDALFLKVDVDELEDVVENFEIKVMPTFILMKNKEQLALLEGNVPDQLREAVEQNVK
uniref:Thioredoxin n=1 Tax=Plectus sambesii TaxID=2011161 RepID=A0A914ULF6_9BILA